MERTPNKPQTGVETSLVNSPKMYVTPVKQNGKEALRKSHYNGASFNVLPCHITPPSGLTKFIARNPFETDLTNRLHLSMISPTVFSKIASPSQHSPGFKWTVEELALIQPAKIEEFPVQQTNCIDPEIEVKAQAAITKFFDENQIIPSPWDSKRKESKENTEMSTPSRPIEDLNLTKDSVRSKKDSWCQTVLSLPSILPPEVEQVLKPYFTFTQDQNTDSDEANSSNNSSLRRKLFFNHEDSAENEDENFLSLSPVKMNGSLALSSSPPQSGMLIYGTPLKGRPQKVQRNHGTPVINSENLSPPDVSPICKMQDVSFEDKQMRPRSATRLEFTMDCSMECSVLLNKFSENNCSDTAIDVPATKTVDRIGELTNLCNNYRCMNTNSVDAEMISRDTTVMIGSIETEDYNNKYSDIMDAIKHMTERKSFANESSALQCAGTQLGVSGQSSAFNSAQDTGYQTYSMSSTTNTTEGSGNSPIKQKLLWGEQVLMNEDDVQLLDWKENIKNVFSSTPSRYNRERRE